MLSVSSTLSVDPESTSAWLHQITSLCGANNALFQPTHAFELDSALHPLAGEHCVDSASRRKSGTLKLVRRPLAGEHCVDLSSHRPSGTLELDAAPHQLADRSVAESAPPVQPTHVPITSSTKQSRTSASLKCIQLNARSLNNKFLSFHNLIYSDSDDIIVITQSWLRPNITDGFIDHKNKYNIFRHDRAGRQGGGVCILTSKCLNVVQVQFTAKIEAVCLDINVLMLAVLFTDSLSLTDHH